MSNNRREITLAPISKTPAYNNNCSDFVRTRESDLVGLSNMSNMSNTTYHTAVPAMTPPPPRQRLMTPCWCQRYADLVNTDDIAQGRTWTCGHPDCKPPEETT